MKKKKEKDLPNLNLKGAPTRHPKIGDHFTFTFENGKRLICEVIAIIENEKN